MSSVPKPDPHIVVHTYGIRVGVDRYDMLPRKHRLLSKHMEKFNDFELCRAHHGAAVGLLEAIKEGAMRDVRVCLYKMSKLMAEVVRRSAERTDEPVTMGIEEDDASTYLETAKERPSEGSTE